MGADPSGDRPWRRHHAAGDHPGWRPHGLRRACVRRGLRRGCHRHLGGERVEALPARLETESRARRDSLGRPAWTPGPPVRSGREAAAAFRTAARRQRSGSSGSARRRRRPGGRSGDVSGGRHCRRPRSGSPRASARCRAAHREQPAGRDRSGDAETGGTRRHRRCAIRRGAFAQRRHRVCHQLGRTQGEPRRHDCADGHRSRSGCRGCAWGCVDRNRDSCRPGDAGRHAHDQRGAASNGRRLGRIGRPPLCRQRKQRLHFRHRHEADDGLADICDRAVFGEGRGPCANGARALARTGRHSTRRVAASMRLR